MYLVTWIMPDGSRRTATLWEETWVNAHRCASGMFPDAIHIEVFGPRR